VSEPALFDLIVIGGGVNGAGVARDAAGRGARVLLLEAGDLASGTSSKSTKLVHGGLRYLEYREFGLVREALKERDVLWDIAPHIVRPMRFVLPVSRAMRPHWQLRAALKLYDTIGGKSALPGSQAIELAEHRAGEPLFGNMARGFEYSDCWVDDARLVVLNAVDAKRKGAEVRTHEAVTGLGREDDGDWLVHTAKGQYRAKAVVNAAGLQVDELTGLAGEKPQYRIRRVRGSHIVVPRLFEHNYPYILQQPDTRICFAIPYEDKFTLIGTTDADHTGSLDTLEPDEDEIRYLCDAVNRYFTRQVTPADIVWSYAGVRALVDDGSSRPEAATRGYKLVLSEEKAGAPLLGIYGGKITSYRHVAEEVVDMLAKRLPALSGEAWTGTTPLPGGDFPKDASGLLRTELRAEYPFLDDFTIGRISRAYGLDAVYWLGDAQGWDDLGRNFGAGLTEAEVNYLREEEWAQTAKDILWRRSKLGLHMDAGEQVALKEFLGG